MSPLLLEYHRRIFEKGNDLTSPGTKETNNGIQTQDEEGLLEEATNNVAKYGDLFTFERLGQVLQESERQK